MNGKEMKLPCMKKWTRVRLYFSMINCVFIQCLNEQKFLVKQKYKLLRIKQFFINAIIIAPIFKDLLGEQVFLENWNSSQ